MAIKPNDPYRDPLLDPDLSVSSDSTTRDIELENARLRGARLDNELQVDPELDEGHGIAILVVLGAVIYGLNSSRTDTASNPAPTIAAQNTPALPTANPAPNTAPGVTTGSAPQPAAPITSGQNGGQSN